MEAYSTATGKHYPSWDDLVEAETNGWTTVVIMSKRTKKGRGPEQFFARVLGPFDSKREARNMAARIRREWQRATERHEIEPGLMLRSVNLEAAWKEFH